ncbi:DUF5719 family protein [Demequina sp. SYSU T00192]|uniref:DUF5719 family protein n=1 Tax=Demequina litoralis TaxID=3051660 RepID=A0ABT8G6Y4_9MICO|nr:DUF5719 family protein [Demequina sp. SYSU T00192]MDN4474913.1 DUF5719 family protein [Demequina sp. SYSU T00192]
MIRRLVVLGAATVAVLAVVAAGRIVAEAPVAAAPYEGDVTPAEQPLACPGPVEIPVGDIDSGDPDLGSGSDDRTYQALGDGATPTGAGFLATGEVAGSVERIGGGDVAGLSAATCVAPVRDQWLVGGSTALGSSARLVLTNPSDASTEATVTLYGGLGALEEHAVVSIAPGGQQDLLLESVAAEVPALAVRVVATGAGVVAHLQDSRLDGFQPAGTDWVGRGAAPSTRLVIPGVGTEDDATTTVRLMSPDGATADLMLAGDEGLVEWGGVSGLVLEPGVVTEVEVPAIASGAVEVRADAPVVAAAMLSVPRPVVDGPADAVERDLAWLPAQDVSDRMPRSAIVTDHVTAVTVHAAVAGEFTLTDADGEVVVSQQMTARSTATLALEVPAGTVLTGSPRFTWSLALEDEPGFVAALTPRRTDIEPVPVTVGLRPYLGPGS